MKSTDKPGFVLDSHSSRPFVTKRLKQPTRRLNEPFTPAYLVLLRMGFTLPLVLPRVRCALTAPFHPYLIPINRAIGGYAFCCTFHRFTASGH